MRHLLPVLLLAACTATDDDDSPLVEGPYGIPLIADGLTYAGVANIDITPALAETWTDVDGNHHFPEGCVDNQTGDDCTEPFEDADGDGVFEPVWIGGYDYLRPMLGVRAGDGISARAIVLAQDGAYVALVAVDLVGLGHNRFEEAMALLEADGFDGTRFLGGSTHNHQGPDSLGLWGDPLSGISGVRETYQQTIVQGMVDAVKTAAADMVPVDLRINSGLMRDRSPWFNGSVFGGKNPTAKMHGMVHDIRDPVLVSDQVLVMQGVDATEEVVFTFTNWSGHPEVRGSDNNELSADWVGVTRKILEERYGGIAVHLPESLGGMQSALGGDLPLISLDGEHVYEVCTVEAIADLADTACFGKTVGDTRVDADGDEVPLWAEHDSWEFVISHGWHIAEAAVDLIDAAEPSSSNPIRLDYEDGYVPVRNIAYNLLGQQGIFDIPLEGAITDPALCPDAGRDVLGCLPFRTSRVEIGGLTLVTAPGELLPELAWGFPEDDPDWQAESADPTRRRPESRYFPQHDTDCNTTIDSFEACREDTEVGDCNCLSIHAWPYTLSASGGFEPVLADITTPHKAILSATQQYLSYIIPEPDTNTYVSLFTDDGDHYEDTVTISWDYATKYLEAQQKLAQRW